MRSTKHFRKYFLLAPLVVACVYATAGWSLGSTPLESAIRLLDCHRYGDALDYLNQSVDAEPTELLIIDERSVSPL